MKMRFVAAMAWVSIGLAACGGATTPADVPAVDSGTPDTGSALIDSGTPDTGPRADTGFLVIDVTLMDIPPRIDQGFPDTNITPIDVTATVDSTSSDATDATTPDTNIVDSSPGFDAGVDVRDASVPSDVSPIEAGSPSTFFYPNRGGFVMITHSSTGGSSTQLSANFWDDIADITPGSTPCSTRFVGVCSVFRCADFSTMPVDAGRPPYISAGTLAVTNGMGTPVIANQMLATGNYQQDVTAAGPFAVGTPVRTAASGAAVPPFGFDRLIPAAPTVTSVQGQSDAGGFIQLTPSAGLTVRWSPGGGNVNLRVVDIVAFSARAELTLVDCSFPSSAGMGTVPPMALSDITVHDADAGTFFQTTLQVLGHEQQETVVGGYQILYGVDHAGFNGQIIVN